MGGLTTAVLLAREAGQRVLVLERHYTVGGYTHSFRRPGYEWDVGVHYIGEVGKPGLPLHAAFDYLSEGKLEWASMGEVYDRFVFPSRTFDFRTGRKQLEADLVEAFPEKRDAIANYLRTVGHCVHSIQRFYVEKAIPAPVATIAGPLMRRPFLKFARRTTQDVLNELDIRGELSSLLTGQWGDYGLTPSQSSFAIHALVTRHYQRGGYYPIGGSAVFADSMIPAIARGGGEVLVNAPVQRITIENGRAVGVEMEDGRELRAKRVISNAGARNTYLRLLSEESRPKTASRWLEGLLPSLSFVNLYVGLDATDEHLGLPKCNYWVFPGPDHDENVRRYLNDSSAPLPVAYISFPSGKEPTFAKRFPGHSTIQVIAPAAYDWFQRWENEPWKKRGADYDQLKTEFTERLLDILKEQVPQVQGHIQHAELSSPLSNRHFAGYAGGEPYGLPHTPQRFRERRLLRPQSPVPRLYLTGQDVSTCGIAGAMAGGVLCASAILGKNLFGQITKA